jgi:hypothetical protein
MCRMAAHTISEHQIDRLISRSKRVRLWIAGFSLLTIAVAVAVFSRRPDLFRAAHSWVIALIAVFCVQPLVRIGWNWNRWPQKERNAYGKVRVEISSDTVRVLDGWGREILLNASEITRAEDRSWTHGLCLRTRNRYRWFLIPRTLDGFASIKRDLAQMGIPVVELRFPPNWEEFVGVAAFCGTTLCVLFTRNPKILTVNLLLAALVSASAIRVIRANPHPALRWPRMMLGALLPLIAAAAALWYSVHRR